jgi:hypothetical protein
MFADNDRDMTLLRVRVELVDAPGALAGVTAGLAALGVDVAAVDVLDVDGRTVVDELLLRLPQSTNAQEVEDVLRLGGAVDVLSIAPGNPSTDPAVAALELARGVLIAPGDADAPGRALARSAYADVGSWVDVGAASRYPLARRTLDEGVPASGRAHPDASPLGLPTGWVLWVAPQVPDPTRLAVVGRRLNVRFAATEAARVRAFATLLDVVSRLQPGISSGFV